MRKKNSLNSQKNFGSLRSPHHFKIASAGPVNTTLTPTEQAAGEMQLGIALRGLFALAEAYPDLKANESFSEAAG